MDLFLFSLFFFFSFFLIWVYFIPFSALASSSIKEKSKMDVLEVEGKTAVMVQDLLCLAVYFAHMLYSGDLD